MDETVPAYGLWSLVIINSAIFIFFAFSFIKPKTRLDWRSLGAFSAFIVALFAEMYGFPLTIYFLSGWLQAKFPQSDIFAHGSGHLWYTLFGFKGDPHLNPIHLLSNVLIFGGFYLTYRAWLVLHVAQQQGKLAVTGPYGLVRHPQYDGFILVMLGFLLMWPTLLTLAMFPVLVIVYIRLARREEELVRREFGSAYDEYAKDVPAFLPRLARRAIPHLAIFFVFLLLYVGCDRDSSKAPLPQAGEKSAVEKTIPGALEKMPAFNLVQVQDGALFSSEALHGRVALVSFFRPWCGSCVAEMAMLQEFQAAHGTAGFVAIGMAMVDRTDKELKLFVEKYGMGIPILVSDEEAAQGFGGILTIPTAFLIDRQGNIVKKYVSHLDKDQLSSDITQLLQGTGDPGSPGLSMTPAIPKVS